MCFTKYLFIRSAALAFHNAQLQATAFGEEFDEDAFEDLTAPKVDMIHKVRSRAAFCSLIWSNAE